MRRSLLLVLGMVAWLVMWAVPYEGNAQSPDDVNRAHPKIAETGTVVFNKIEGGFYGIIADSGRRYDPLNLSEAFRVDGLRVRFTAERQQTRAVGVHMWGVPVRLIQIEDLH